MRVCFVAFEVINPSRGISKKIVQQVDAFKLYGDVDFIHYNIDDSSKKRYYRQYNESRLRSFSTNKYLSFLERSYSFKDVLELLDREDYDIVYIRYNHIGNLLFNRFLKKLKNKGVKILLEIPTYPYDLEYKNSKWIVKLKHFEERYYRDKFNKYVDYIVTYSKEDYIFRIPTINISNGIDLSVVPLRLFDKKKNDSFNLICVASMEFWHGYDRLIRGLSEYYKNSTDNFDVTISLVGPTNTKSSQEYRKLVKDLELEDKVLFLGSKSGTELDYLFNISDLAVGCLACHRKGISDIKSLKNREYCARGIPFIYSENDSDFDKLEFILKMSADESAIDINLLISWLRALEITENDLRIYAEKKLTWKMQINKIFNKIGL